MGSTCSHVTSASLLPPPPPGRSKAAASTPAHGLPRLRTAFTAEQVSTLESSFQQRRYLCPVERRWLAQKMRLSEVQVRPLGPGWPRWAGAVACGLPSSDLVFPTDKNLVSESPDETQTPAAGRVPERPPPWSSLHAPGFLPAALCPEQQPAAAVPLGVPPWALGAGRAPWLLLASLSSGASLPGLGVGLQ